MTFFLTCGHCKVACFCAYSFWRYGIVPKALQLCFIDFGLLSVPLRPASPSRARGWRGLLGRIRDIRGPQNMLLGHTLGVHDDSYGVLAYVSMPQALYSGLKNPAAAVLLVMTTQAHSLPSDANPPDITENTIRYDTPLKCSGCAVIARPVGEPGDKRPFLTLFLFGRFLCVPPTDLTATGGG